jgi:hypothetical protein
MLNASFKQEICVKNIPLDYIFKEIKIKIN